ncbi:extracellular solute-binding protein [Psychromonas sp. MME2]|uniref:sugar ABC transporter substrate-binding protein n=1 Tax=unclassified Psychromonas TaxID=2614957 RepID=UPI00339CD6F7
MQNIVRLLKLMALPLFMLLFSTHLIAASKIVFWTTQQHNDYLDNIISNFEKNHGIEIELHQFLAEDLRDEVVTLARTAELPDMLYIPSDFVGMHNEIKLSPIPSSWFSQHLSMKIRSISKINETSYGIPVFQGNHLMLFYNREMVTTPITDWQQLKEQSRSFSDQVTFPITWHYSEMYWLIPFISAYQSWPMVGDNVTLNTPGMVKALRFYQNLAKDKLVDPNCDHTCSVANFKNGQSPYLIDGDWIIHTLEKEMGNKLGIATLPKVEGQTMYPMFGSYVLAFPNLQEDSEKYKILEKFALYTQGLEAQQLVLDEGGLMPVNDKILADAYTRMNSNEKAVMEQINFTHPLPTSPNMSVAWFAMKRGFVRLMEHNYTPEQTALFMQRTASKELSRQNKTIDK